MPSFLRIGVDIDDVIADLTTMLAQFHNDLHGSTLTREDFTSYDFCTIWGGTRDETVRKVDEMFTHPQYYKQIAPINGSYIALYLLEAAGADLYAVTGRRDCMRLQTQDWLTEHFPAIFKDIFFTNAFCLQGKSVKKSAVCKQIGVTVLIEDYMMHALDCAEHDIKVLLYDTPWNKDNPLHENVHRVFSWREIASFFMS